MSKLIIVVVQGGCHDIVQRLIDAGHHVTRFSSIGGFLRHKSTTLLIGAPPEEVEPALTLIREHCGTLPGAEEHAATIFVLEAAQFVAV